MKLNFFNIFERSRRHLYVNSKKYSMKTFKKDKTIKEFNDIDILRSFVIYF
jgi:hypothetical protein